MPSEPDPDPHRRPRESQAPAASPLYNLPSSAPGLPPLRSSSTRHTPAMSGASSSGGLYARLRASEQEIERRRSLPDDRTEFDAAESSGTQWGRVRSGPSDAQREPVRGHRRPITSQRRSRYTLDDITATERELEDVDSELRALWDFTNASPDPYSELAFPSPPLQNHGTAEESRRIKRRKLDSDRLSTGFTGFRYGKYGQVEPGQLTMEIVSCDGGIYADDGQKHAAENILKNDPSVYCTSGPTCNIVLRHQGATVFTLKELVIKAPRSNYTSPVSEGMVFVSMSSDHLLTRTAQYQIQYSSARSSSRRAGSESQPLPPVISIRHNGDGSSMTRAQVRARRLYNIGLEDENNDLRVAQIPSEFNISPSHCRVTVEYDDEDADDVDVSREAPNRIGALPFESETSDEEGNMDDFTLSGASYRQRASRIRSSGYAEAREAAQIATQEAVRAVGGGLLAPDARFYIERDKSKCTMTFDPPVSGRFILLKMWSPHRDPTANIDIQAVAATGFAGPRFFPAVELR
ncbi:hypothetical protein DL770_000447 [Monosporascus sp. CRB-9-2]|nr:hypothetical protein DL770_000447 [Monosporascus sp. CRB-9-2]